MSVSGYLTRPDYRVDLMRRRNLVTASVGGAKLASSSRTIVVDEQNHGLVVYFPPDDVEIGSLKAIADRTSFCPYKGEASYWALVSSPAAAIAWSYLTPFDEVIQIRNYVAFYQHLVDVRLGGETN
jgi:uncharacterized protein (DUF427 family)